MRKLSMQFEDEIHDERPRSRLPRLLMFILVLAAAAPLAIEGASLCMANWKEYAGTSAAVKTPVLDAISEALGTAREACGDQISPLFRRIPWDPKMVVLTAAIIMGVAMLLLRR
jgi:hypothetical protein